MFKKARKIIGLTLVSSMMLGGCASTSTTQNASTDVQEKGSKESDKKQSGAPIVVTYACTNPDQKDPYRKDPVTGEYIMPEEQRADHIRILEEIKEELNVDLQFVPIPGYIWEVLLQTVLAGDPLADLVDLEINSQGRILAQNVLQPLDDYIDLLGDSPSPKMFGKYFFLESAASGQSWSLSPLLYNIDYIEAVDALKVNGETVYPTDLYKEGNWTWSTFTKYLQAIDSHYANSSAPERPENRIEAFKTDYTETLIEAIHANGGALYGEDGLQIDTPEVKQAVAYVQELIDKKLLTANIIEGTSDTPWASQATNFNLGETVFTEIENWRVGEAASKAKDRGQSLGVIPFPRPDHMAADDPRYQPSVTKGGSTVIPKGVEEDKIPLVIKTYNLYREKVDAYWEEQEADEADELVTLNGTDIFHEKIGQDMAEIYDSWNAPVNEYSIMVGVYWNFMEIAGDALWGANGSPGFDIAYEQKKHEITDKISSVEALLNTDEVKDNVAPALTQVTPGEVYAVPVGTDPSTLDWKDKFAANDNLDGALDMATAKWDMALTDFSTVGEYQDGLIVTIQDASENTGRTKQKLVIYDANNTEAPTLTLKEEYRTLAVDEDSAAINWGDFVEAATDKDGLNLMSKVVADLSELDTTTKGEYDVALTVTDFAGNTSEVMVKVEVK
ncbi:MAG: hypothetical protein ACRCW2_08315 [Cellulosilyticaceae bacterium]